MLLLVSSLHHCLLMVIHWSLSDSKSPQVSRTFLSILVDLNNTVVLMLSARSLIFNSSSPLSKLLGIVRVHQLLLVSLSCSIAFISSLVISKYLSLFSFSLIFIQWSSETAKSTIRHVLFFFPFFFFFLLSFS